MTEKFYPYIVICKNRDRYGCDDIEDARRTAKKHGGVIRTQVGNRNPATHDSLAQIRNPADAGKDAKAEAARVKAANRAKLEGEAEATRATIVILDNRGQATQAAALRRELATALRNGDERAIRAVRSKVVALFSTRSNMHKNPGEPLQNPGERPPAGFESFYVQSVGEAADTVTFKRTKSYDVIAPDGSVGKLMSHGGKYRFHEQLDLFGHKMKQPPPEPVKAAKEPSRQIGMLFNPAGRRANPLGLIAAYAATTATDHAAKHVIKHAKDRHHNPAVAPADASNWLHNRVYKEGDREFLKTYPTVHGKRQRAEVDVSAIAPVIKEIQALNEWRYRLPAHPDAAPPKLARAAKAPRAGCHISALVTKCDDTGVPWGSALMANGRTIEYVWQVLDLNDIVISHHADSLTVNAKFPQELQPRDRSRAGYHAQIDRLVREFDPSLLMWSANASDGAPIIGPTDGVVESGNGRSISLTRIYASHPAKARQYKQTAKQWCLELGCEWPKWADSALARPVLVRSRQTVLDRAEFARQANVAGQQVMSATEMAIADAAAMTPSLLNQLDGAAGIGSMKNAGFVASFIKYVAGEAARGDMVDAHGKLSSSGESRIDYALFARAWGGKAHNLIALMAEVRESDLRTILGALLAAAVPWCRFADQMDKDVYDRAYDQTHAIVSMVQRVRAAKEADSSVHQMRNQDNSFGKLTTEENLWLCAAFPKGRLPNAITFARAIADYVDLVVDAGPSSQGGMFAPVPAIEFVRRAVVGVVCEQLEATKKPVASKATIALQTAQRFDDVATVAIMPAEWIGEMATELGMPARSRSEILAIAKAVIEGDRVRNPACRCGGRCGPCRSARVRRSSINRKAGR